MSTYANRTLHTRWDFDTETGRLIPGQNKTRSFKKMARSYFQRTRPECKIENFYATGRQKKLDCVSVDGFCCHCNTVFEAMGYFYHFCICQEVRPSVTEEDIQRGIEEKELNELRRNYMKQNGFTVIEMLECKWWRLYKTGTTVKEHIREMFPCRRSLEEYQLLEEIKSGKLLGYVQCNIEVPNKLKLHFANFLPLIKNTLVARKYISEVMKQYAEEEGLMSQPQKMLISSFTIQNGTLITPLLLFYLESGLV